MAESTIAFMVLAGAVILFVSNRVPVALVAVALSLWATGILELEEALGGFGDPTVTYIAALFVVSEALDAAGVTAWVAQQLVARGRDEPARVVSLIMVVCALATALISVNGAVAALVPVVVVIGVRVRLPSSQLLMPLAFGARAGTLLALTGQPGQRARRGRGGRRGRGTVRVRRVRARRHPAPGGHDRHHGADRRPCAPTPQRQVHASRFQCPRRRPRRGLRPRRR